MQEEMEETAFKNEAAPEEIVIKTVLDITGIEEALKREEYARRNAQAIKDREDVLRRNGVIGPDETLTMDTEAALRQRCCF